MVASGQVILAELPLPIAGLMSDLSLGAVADRLGIVGQAVRGLGATLPDPFMTLSFMALPVIPKLKITDRGLFDVEKFEVISLFVQTNPH